MSRITSPSFAFALICALSLGACSTGTPVEKLEARRAEYKASLNSFFIKETPLEVEPMPGEEGEDSTEPAAAEEASQEAAEGGEEMATLEPEVRLDAMLDVIVQHDSRAPLDGVTLDITMVDGDQQEVARWRRWVDTAGLPKANQRPVSLVLEDVDYQEGYGFFVEVRSPIAESDRGEYREFDGV